MKRFFYKAFFIGFAITLAAPSLLIATPKTESLESKREKVEAFLKAHPDSIKAREKLAEIYMAQQNWEKAFDTFKEILRLDTCNANALNGLSKLGEKWLYDPKRKKENVEIYHTLSHCQSSNPDWLYLYARALYQTKKFDLAEKTANQALKIAPNYADADILIGLILKHKHEYEKATAIFQKYPNHPDAVEGLKAIEREERPYHLEKALAAHQNLQFDLAYEHYSWLIQDDAEEFDRWPAALDSRSHIRPSLSIDFDYTEAKENDPSLRAPVVKDYYFLNQIQLKLPVSNRVRFSLKQIYYHQRENDIYPPIGVNYSAESEGGEIGAEVFFARYFRFDLSAKGFRMTGDSTATYPFKNATRFEPGATFFFNNGDHFISLNAHRESYIIKDFSVFKSKLLSTDFYTFGYGFKMNRTLSFQLEAFANYVRIHDHQDNWKHFEEASARLSLPIPRFWKYFFLLYRFEFGHYDKLNLNYYSYDRQYRNTAGILFEYFFTTSTFWQVAYEHRWQRTYQLFQPIGNSTLIQGRQYLAANRITSKFGSQFKDRWKIELEGHYFHETLPYRDWNLKGKITFQF